MTETLRIECVYAGAGTSERREIEVRAPVSVSQAVAISGLAAWLAERDLAVAGYAVFGRKVEADTELADGDRVEVLRPLLVTPTQARRLRAAARHRSG